MQALLYRVNALEEQSTVVDSAGLYLTPYRRQGLRLEGQTFTQGTKRHSPIFGPDGAAAFYKRAMLTDVNLGDGVFDEAFFMHKEDVDLCWRARLMGWTSEFVPEAVAYHIRTFRAGQRHRVSGYLRTIAARNRYYLLIKNELFTLFFRDVLWIMLYELGIFLYILFRERPSFEAYHMVVQEYSRLIQKRAAIQSHRRVRSNDIARWFQWRPV